MSVASRIATFAIFLLPSHVIAETWTLVTISTNTDLSIDYESIRLSEQGNILGWVKYEHVKPEVINGEAIAATLSLVSARCQSQSLVTIKEFNQKQDGSRTAVGIVRRDIHSDAHAVIPDSLGAVIVKTFCLRHNPLNPSTPSKGKQ